MTPTLGVIEVSNRSGSQSQRRLSSATPRSSTNKAMQKQLNRDKLKMEQQALKSKEFYLQHLKGKRAGKKIANRTDQTISPDDCYETPRNLLPKSAFATAVSGAKRGGTEYTVESYRDYQEHKA